MDIAALSSLEIALERKIYENSFYEFYKAAFCQLHPGTEYDENWHAKYIADILQAETERVIAKKPREKDIIINVPPRSSKSMLVTVIWPVWSWTKDPSLKFLRCSYSDTIATILARHSKDLILTNWFQRLYGDRIELRGDLSGAGLFGNTNTGFMYAFGLDGTVTGIGGDFIIADDPQNPKKANSEVERANAIERWNTTISNRLNQLDQGGRIIVMQRLHQCLLPNSLITVPKGVKQIADIVDGDAVISSQGIDLAIETSNRSYEGEIYGIKTWGHFDTLWVTDCHKILTERGYVEAKNLSTEDVLVNKIDVGFCEDMGFVNDKFPAIEPGNQFKRYVGNIKAGWTPKFDEVNLIKLLEKHRSIVAVARELNVHRNTVQNAMVYFGLRVQKRNEIPVSILSHNLFWRFIGYWLAEGCVTKSRGKHNLIRLVFM